MLGPIADQVAGEIRAAAAIPTADNPIDRATAIIDVLASAGIRAVRRCGSRLLIDLNDPSAFPSAELERLNTRGWVITAAGIQLIVGPDAEAVQREIGAKQAPA